jgi:hypothetical protein
VKKDKAGGAKSLFYVKKSSASRSSYEGFSSGGSN